MKALKILLGVVIVIVLLVAVVFGVVLGNLDKIVKTTVEEVGPRVLGTEVGLQEVDITLKDGRAELHNLTVHNPEGFSDANAISLGAVAVEIDPASIGGDVKVINEVLISDIQLLAEQKNLTDNNLQALLDKVTSGAGSSEQVPAEEDTGASEPVLLAVKKFTFAGGKIQLSSEQLGDAELDLPSISLENLGSAENGLTPEQLAAEALKPVLATAKKAVQDYVTKEAKGKATEALQEKLKEKLGEEDTKRAMDEVKNLLGN